MPESTFVLDGIHTAHLLKHGIESLHRFHGWNIVNVIDFEKPEE
jgi:hypothetical protein